MPRRRPFMPALMLIAATTALACTGSDDGTSSGVTVSDSAGVTTVQIDDLDALPLPERTTTTSVEVGQRAGSRSWIPRERPWRRDRFRRRTARWTSNR